MSLTQDVTECPPVSKGWLRGPADEEFGSLANSRKPVARMWKASLHVLSREALI